MTRTMGKLRHKLRHCLIWPPWSPNFLRRKKILSDFTDNQSTFTKLLFLFSILSSRMCKNMCKMNCKLKNIKKMRALTLSCYFRNSNGQIDKCIGTKYRFIVCLFFAFLWFIIYILCFKILVCSWNICINWLFLSITACCRTLCSLEDSHGVAREARGKGRRKSDH